MIWRLRRAPSRTDYIWACVGTAALLPFAAWQITEAMPWACATRAGATIYLWGCLLPGLLIIVPPILTAVLCVTLWLNRKRTRPFADGFVPTAFYAGTLTFLTLAVGYSFLLETTYRTQFVQDIFGIPQLFMAGATVGAVFIILIALRQKLA